MRLRETGRAGPWVDLMARPAGMALQERWAWWDRSPFTGTSSSHVSVWVLPGPVAVPVRAGH